MKEILKRWLKRCEYHYSTMLSFETEDIYSGFWEVRIGDHEITPCLFDSIRLDIQSVLDEHSQHINRSVNNIGSIVNINFWFKNEESVKEMRRIINNKTKIEYERSYK